MAGLVAKNLKELSGLGLPEYRVILLTCLLFALVHYPSVPLMAYAFVMEFIFLKVYFKWNNLLPLGLFHGWVSGLFLYFVLGRDLWGELWAMF